MGRCWSPASPPVPICGCPVPVGPDHDVITCQSATPYVFLLIATGKASASSSHHHHYTTAAAIAFYSAVPTSTTAPRSPPLQRYHHHNHLFCCFFLSSSRCSFSSSSSSRLPDIGSSHVPHHPLPVPGEPQSASPSPSPTDSYLVYSISNSNKTPLQTAADKGGDRRRGIWCRCTHVDVFRVTVPCKPPRSHLLLLSYYAGHNSGVEDLDGRMHSSLGGEGRV